jgi:hypothetical protein
MMDATFVKAIRETAETKVVSINGKEYASREVHNPPLPMEPRVSTLEIETLTGLVNYCNELEIDGLDANALFIHIESPEVVSLLSKITGEQRQRDVYVKASIEHVEGFSFGEWMAHGQFMIGLQANFMDYGDRSKVLKVLGTIRDEAVKTSSDDGVTQRVTASAGIALAAEVAVPNPVVLRPYRTFLEIEQPPSEFILRVRQSAKGQIPDVALFEADGGKWEREAVAGIREYLATKILHIAILA